MATAWFLFIKLCYDIISRIIFFSYLIYSVTVRTHVDR